jgi:hypothetical protein
VTSVVRVRAEAEVRSFPSACFYDNRKIMKKSINDNRKTRGRPATGTAPLVGVRMTQEFQDAIKAWAEKQPDNPALATAIRRLVEISLSAAPKASPTERLKAARKSMSAATGLEAKK